jgi:hypothetical protein
MRKRLIASAFAAAATVLAFGSLAAGPAMASGGSGGSGGSGRPCGPASSTSGTGTLGSTFTLKSMYDDDGATPGVIIGEEFEISTPAGQVWAVTLSDNGKAFFSGNATSSATGIRVQQATPYPGGTSDMAAHAVSQQTGEVVNGSVGLPVAPAACGN